LSSRESIAGLLSLLGQMTGIVPIPAGLYSPQNLPSGEWP
jgi:hypothetical protein